MNIDELFRFKETEDGCIITEFYQNNYFGNKDEIVTETEIPDKYKGTPVTAIGSGAFVSACYLQKVTIPEGVRHIGEGAFQNCESLRSVSFPASLEKLGSRSFQFCGELREAEFKSNPSFGLYVFDRDFKLPAEIILAGLVCSRDLTLPLNSVMLENEIAWAYSLRAYRITLFERPDVFELAAKNGCLTHIDTESLFKVFIDKERFDLLRIAERYGLFDDAEFVDRFVEYSVERKNAEAGAYFLDLKRRKFGFDGGDKFTL